MKIENITIKNFRGIRSAALTDLNNMVVIAGQNGSGKSCVLDAIRLLKSVYGGYQANEWQHWMGEFQINFSNRNDLETLLNNPAEELRITCEFSIHSGEREYIGKNAEDLVRQSIWRAMYPELYSWSVFTSISLAAHLRGREDEIQEKTITQLAALTAELTKDRIVGEFILPVGKPPTVRASKVLEIIFGTFRPHYLGVLDYHGPHRMYTRETLQGINLNLEALENQRSQHALYNYVNKYANVKAEMASSYIKEILAGAAGKETDGRESLSKTLQELFKTFFPDKEFLGPIPTKEGLLQFPVKTADGATHDLNELSAGEKEVLYGYLRLRNSAPRYSVILLDEPELHLNPRLIKGLTAFYHQHLGKALDNQIWLITHSDALLRDAVGHEGYSVFHMQTATLTNLEQQASPLVAKEGLQRAIIDLVGDLASYRPDAKLIIFEGENSEFDERLANSLFPTLGQKVNTVSAGSKQRVQGLHEVLGLALEKGQVPMKVFSIVDWDAEGSNPIPERSYRWDVYHIENYLLEPKFVLKIVRDLGITAYSSEEDVYEALRSCARETLPSLLRHQLGNAARSELLKAIHTGTDPHLERIAPALAATVKKSADSIQEIAKNKFTEAELEKRELELRGEFEKALATDTWRKRFRGRDILHRFVARIHKTNYEVFRDLIIAAMRDAGHQPEGMRSIIDEILTA